MFIKPQQHIHNSINSRFSTSHSMTIFRIIVKFTRHSHWFQHMMIIHSLMRSYSFVCTTNYDQSRCFDILHNTNRWFLEESIVVIFCDKVIQVLVFGASMSPVRDVGGRIHVRHVDDRIPKNCCFKEVFVERMAYQPPSQKASMTTSVDSYSILIN